LLVIHASEICNRSIQLINLHPHVADFLFFSLPELTLRDAILFSPPLQSEKLDRLFVRNVKLTSFLTLTTSLVSGGSSLGASRRYCIYVAAAAGGAWPSGEMVLGGENGYEFAWNGGGVVLRLLGSDIVCCCIGNGNEVMGDAVD
jgi:hypothetical protein